MADAVKTATSTTCNNNNNKQPAVRSIYLTEQPLQYFMIDSGDSNTHHELSRQAVLYHILDPILCSTIRRGVLQACTRREVRRRDLPRRDHEFIRSEQVRRAVLARSTWRHQDETLLTPRHRIESWYKPLVCGPTFNWSFVRARFPSTHKDRIPSQALPVAQPVSLDTSHLATMWDGTYMMSFAPKTRGVFAMLVFGTFCGHKLAVVLDRAWKVHAVKAPAPKALYHGTVLMGEIVRLRSGLRNECVFIIFDADMVCGVSVGEYAHAVRIEAAHLALQAWIRSFSASAASASLQAKTSREDTVMMNGSDPVAVVKPIFTFLGIVPPNDIDKESNVADTLPWAGYNPLSPVYGPSSPSTVPLGATAAAAAATTTAASSNETAANAARKSQAIAAPYTPPLSPVYDQSLTSPVMSSSSSTALPPPRPMSPLSLSSSSLPPTSTTTTTSVSLKAFAFERSAKAPMGEKKDDKCMDDDDAEKEQDMRDPQWPFRIRVKRFYRASDVPSMMADVLPFLDHEVEGLICVQVDGRITYKLKLEHSIDMYADVIDAHTVRWLVLDDAYVVWATHRVESHDLTTVQPAGCIHTLSDLHGRIVECTYDASTKRWLPHIIRLGKLTPNSLRTALATWNNYLQDLKLTQVLPHEIAPHRRDILEAFDSQPLRTWQPMTSAPSRPPPVPLYPSSFASLAGNPLPSSHSLS